MNNINQDAIMLQLLLELDRRTKEDLPFLKLQDAYAILATKFALSEDQLDALTPKLKENKWENDVRFACENLRQLGLAYNPERGILRITDKGQKKLKELSLNV